MLLKELFQPADFVLDYRPSDKWAAIQALMDDLVRRGRVPEDRSDEWQEKIEDRERSMSTGMERGIAIPHAAIDDAGEVVAAIGIVQKAEGLTFESIDGGATWIVVLLLIPRSQKLLHIRTLADIARVLGNEDVRDALRAAKTSEDAWQALAEGESALQE